MSVQINSASLVVCGNSNAVINNTPFFDSPLKLFVRKTITCCPPFSCAGHRANTHCDRLDTTFMPDPFTRSWWLYIPHERIYFHFGSAATETVCEGADLYDKPYMINWFPQHHVEWNVVSTPRAVIIRKISNHHVTITPFLLLTICTKLYLEKRVHVRRVYEESRLVSLHQVNAPQSMAFAKDALWAVALRNSWYR